MSFEPCIETTVEAFGSAVVPSLGDNSCLFNSVVLHLTLEAAGERAGELRRAGLVRAQRAQAADLRRRVADFMLEHPDAKLNMHHMQESLRTVIRREEQCAVADYARRVAGPALWGGELEVCVLARILRRPVCVYQFDPTRDLLVLRMVSETSAEVLAPTGAGGAEEQQEQDHQRDEPGFNPLPVYLFLDGWAGTSSAHFDLLVRTAEQKRWNLGADQLQTLGLAEWRQAGGDGGFAGGFAGGDDDAYWDLDGGADEPIERRCECVGEGFEDWRSRQETLFERWSRVQTASTWARSILRMDAYTGGFTEVNFPPQCERPATTNDARLDPRCVGHTLAPSRLVHPLLAAAARARRTAAARRPPDRRGGDGAEPPLGPPRPPRALLGDDRADGVVQRRLDAAFARAAPTEDHCVHTDALAPCALRSLVQLTVPPEARVVVDLLAGDGRALAYALAMCPSVRLAVGITPAETVRDGAAAARIAEAVGGGGGGGPDVPVDAQVDTLQGAGWLCVARRIARRVHGAVAGGVADGSDARLGPQFESGSALGDLVRDPSGDGRWEQALVLVSYEASIDLDWFAAAEIDAAWILSPQPRGSLDSPEGAGADDSSQRTPLVDYGILNHICGHLSPFGCVVMRHVRGASRPKVVPGFRESITVELDLLDDPRACEAMIWRRAAAAERARQSDRPRNEPHLRRTAV